MIHTAFNHDFSKNLPRTARTSSAPSRRSAPCSEGSDRPLDRQPRASPLLVAGRHRDGEQIAGARHASASFPRNPEAAVAALAARGVRATAVRLPPSVHGHGDHGFVPRVIAVAREKGVSPTSARRSTAGRPCIGSTRRASFGSRSSAARKAGPFHAVAEEGVPFKEIADGDRPAAGRPGRLAVAGRGGGAFRLVRQIRGDRLPGLQRRDPDRGSAGRPSSPACSPTSTPAYFATVSRARGGVTLDYGIS